jgi:hypothetical protein
MNNNNNKSSTNSLPEITKEECLEIISTITHPQTKDEKIKFHLAITYIRENIKALENKDLKGIIENEHFMKKLGEDYEKKLTHRYTNFNLKVFSKEECIGIFNAISKPQTNDAKYRCHLALSYFRENILSFEAQELKNILSNDYVKTHQGKKFDIEVMSQCIKNGKSLPIILPNWATSSIPKPTLEGYLNIIHDENNAEQLKFFCNNHSGEVAGFIHLKEKISDLLAELHLKIDPVYIYHMKWTEEKSVAWLDKNEYLIPRLFDYLHAYESKMGDNFTKRIYEYTAEKLFTPNKNLADLRFVNSVLNNDNTNFLKYLQKNHSNDLKDLLSLEIEHLNRSDIKLNLAQYLIDTSISIESYAKKSAKILLDIIIENKDLLLEPIKLQTRLYEREITLFEHGLNNSSFLMFSPFNLNDVVEDKHKEQILAAAFCLLQAKHDAFDFNDDDEYSDSSIANYSQLKKWYPQIIEQATPEQVSRFCDRAMKGNENNTNLVKELKALKLKTELNHDLKNNNSTSTARMKI